MTRVLQLLPAAAMAVGFFFSACDKPAPTELTGTNSGDPVTIEAAEQNPAATASGNSYDSTGYVYQLPAATTVIMLSRNTIYENGVTAEYNFGFASFYDRSSPVYTRDGKLAGYTSGRAEFVKFRGIRAAEVPQYLRLRTASGLQDSAIGPKYLLFRKRGSIIGDLFDLEFNLPVEIEIKQFFTAPVSIYVRMPEQIQGSVKNSGNGIITLQWNRESRPPAPNRQIVLRVAGLTAGNRELVPLFTMQTADDGAFTVPASLLRSIPRDRYPKLVLTFFRRMDNTYDGSNGQAVITAQATYSIVVPTP